VNAYEQGVAYAVEQIGTHVRKEGGREGKK